MTRLRDSLSSDFFPEQRFVRMVSASFAVIVVSCAINSRLIDGLFRGIGIRVTLLDYLLFSTVPPFGCIPIAWFVLGPIAILLFNYSTRYLYSIQGRIRFCRTTCREMAIFTIAYGVILLVVVEFFVAAMFVAAWRRYSLHGFFRDDSFMGSYCPSAAEHSWVFVTMVFVADAICIVALQLIAFLGFRHLFKKPTVGFTLCIGADFVICYLMQMFGTYCSGYEAVASGSGAILFFIEVLGVGLLCRAGFSACRFMKSAEGLSMAKVEIKELSKIKRGKALLRDINATFDSGKCYELRGANGSGKTMLLCAIAGLLKPTTGCVVIDGEILGRDIEFPQSVGMLIEKPGFIPSYTGFDNLKLLASIRGAAGGEDIRDAMRKVGLNPDDERKYKAYSLGMKQRLGIACAIMEKPQIVLLDEPLNALDEAGPGIVCDVIERCKRNGAVVVVANHEKGALDSVVDEAMLMREGQICPVDGSD